MVWWACRSHYPSLWCPQAGYLRWVLWGYQGFPWPGRQDPCGPKQGRPGGHTAANACLWGPDVVSGQSYQHPRGGEGVPGLLLGQAPAEHRQSPALWGWSPGPLSGHPGLATQCCSAQAQWPHQKSQTCQGQLVSRRANLYVMLQSISFYIITISSSVFAKLCNFFKHTFFLTLIVRYVCKSLLPRMSVWVKKEILMLFLNGISENVWNDYE